MILDKKQMSEEDIKFHYISPAITAKWDSRKITMETQITDGRVIIGGNLVTRSAFFSCPCSSPDSEVV